MPRDDKWVELSMSRIYPLLKKDEYAERVRAEINAAERRGMELARKAVYMKFRELEKALESHLDYTTDPKAKQHCISESGRLAADRITALAAIDVVITELRDALRELDHTAKHREWLKGAPDAEG